jgi:hypothetical protein
VPFYTAENELELGLSIGGKRGFTCNPQLTRDILFAETGKGMGEDDIGGALVLLESCPHVSRDGPH